MTDERPTDELVRDIRAALYAAGWSGSRDGYTGCPCAHCRSMHRLVCLVLDSLGEQPREVHPLIAEAKAADVVS